MNLKIVIYKVIEYGLLMCCATLIFAIMSEKFHGYKEYATLYITLNIIGLAWIISMYNGYMLWSKNESAEDEK